MGGELDQAMLDKLMEEAGLAPEDPAPATEWSEPVEDSSPEEMAGAPPPTPDENGKVPVHTAQFAPLPATAAQPEFQRSIDFLMEVGLGISVELGRTDMSLRDVLGLSHGAVIELNKVAGEPVDIMVNGTLIARGEVVVVDEKFGVRVTEIVSPARRVASLGGTQS